MGREGGNDVDDDGEDDDDENNSNIWKQIQTTIIDGRALC